MQRYRDTVLKEGPSGLQPTRNASITVFNHGTDVIATIYDTNAYAPKGNPFQANAQGAFYFYAENGRYDVLVRGNGVEVRLDDVLMQDVLTPVEIISEEIERIDLEIIDVQKSIPVKNYAWMGSFSVWQSGSVGSRAVRSYCADGVTFCRLGFSLGVTAYQIAGKSDTNGIRVSRNPTDANTQSAILSFPLTQKETQGLQGKTCCLAFNAYRSDGYSGNVIKVKVSSSAEPEQAIISDNGDYNSGNILLASSEFAPVADSSGFGSTSIIFNVPSNAVQISATLEIPFFGTAGSQDWVAFEKLMILDQPTISSIKSPVFEELLARAHGRYQSSYPYGVARASVVPYGALVDVSRNINGNWAVAFNPRCTEKIFPPTLYFYAPNDGQDFRMTDSTSGTSKNGMGFDLGSNGAKITNNHTPTAAGVVYSVHYAFLALV